MQIKKTMYEDDKGYKRRKVRSTGLVLTAGMLAAVLTACGSSEYNTEAAVADTAAYEMVEDTAYEMAAAEEAGYEMPAAGGMDGMTASNGVTEKALADRKLIKTVNINVETENYDSLVPSLEEQVAALGGYIEQMSSNNRNSYYTDSYDTKQLRYASMTIRIPKENLELFLSVVGEQSNIVSRSESVSDVTLQYVDLESHKKALMTEQSRLLELMEQAETVEDIISIENRLSEVRYQIESMESQLRTYDNQIDYSTVYLYIDEVERYTPADDISTGERIRTGFMESLSSVGHGFYNFGIWFVIHIPYLVVWAVLIVLAIFIFCKLRKYMAKRGAEKKAQRITPYVQPQTPYAQGLQAGNAQSFQPGNVQSGVPQENKTENEDGTQMAGDAEKQ